MTCEECQLLAIDLARGVPPFDVGGAVQRADVLSHIAMCRPCAQWLSVQEALSDALRTAAAADASLSAPPSVEANVMAAFRARQAQRQAQAQRPVRTQRPARTRRPAHTHASPAYTQPERSLVRPEPVAYAEQPEGSARSFWSAWPAGRVAAFAAAAAVVIAALTVASMRFLNPTPSRQGGAGGATGVSAGGSAGASPGVSAGAPASPPLPVAARAGERAGESAGPRVASTTSGISGISPAIAGTNAAVIEVLPEKGKKAPKGRPTQPRVAPPRGANEFSGSAFVLLPYVEPLRPTEMRHIMRVRMTRAQLEAGEFRTSGVDDAAVLADVLVGEDGTARAVRIVQ